MLVIGLTGGIGSGKSTVAKLFSEKNITIIDTDQVARTLTQPGQVALEKIAEKFGEDILLPDKTLNRTKLRKIIFADDTQRIWLEQLLHPLIRAEMLRQIAAANSSYCIAIIPLLLETQPNPIINRILVVDALEQQQRDRAQARDRLSEDDINAILKTQVSREQRLAAADDIIFNHGIPEELRDQVDKLHQVYLGLCQQNKEP